jgi:hypothetical protein
VIAGGLPVTRAIDWRHSRADGATSIPPSSISVYCAPSSAQIVGRMSPCWFFGGS